MPKPVFKTLASSIRVFTEKVKLPDITRYYGGVKLGPGNLKRAYSEAGKEVIGYKRSDGRIKGF